MHVIFPIRVASSPEVCVDALLEASVRYAPYFDWVVAHIGFVLSLSFHITAIYIYLFCTTRLEMIIFHKLDDWVLFFKGLIVFLL